MSVATVLARLATLQIQITGVKYAYANPPRSLVAANMPLFVTIPGGATVTDWSDGLLETRGYDMYCYAAPFESGIPGEAVAILTPLFPLVREFFEARPGLERLANVLEVRWIGDEGITRLSYGGDNYYTGCKFKIEVDEYIPRTYAQFD